MEIPQDIAVWNILMDQDRLHRIRVIHEALDSQYRRQTNVSYRSLVELVQDRLSQEVGAKTIQRDLAAMQGELDLPIVYDRKGQTFRYTHPVSLQRLDLAVVSSLDVVALLIGQQAVGQLRGTPWHDGLKGTFARLLGALPTEIVRRYQTLIEKVRVEGAEVRPVDPVVWETILIGLDDNTILDMTYTSGHDGTVRQRLVDPYGLVIVDRQWQLIAWDHLAQAVRTFLLQRIISITDTEKAFTVRDGFTLDKYLTDAIAGQQSTGTAVPVKLRFTKESTPAGEAQIWHSKEKRSHDAQGRLVVEFKTAALFKVEREVLAWGGMCEILEPRSVRQSVAVAATALAALCV